MGRFNVILVVLFGLFVNKHVFGLDFCGGEDIPKCNLGDNKCLSEELEPGLRKWMLNGQPGYFLESLDPIVFEELPIPTDKGVFKLKNVKLAGFGEAKFSDSSIDLVKKSIKYTYVYKFDLSAEQFIDQNGQSLLDQGPLLIHLDNLSVDTKADFVTVGRCNEKYVKFTKSEANVKDIKDEDVNIKSGLKSADLAIKQAIAQTSGKAATRRVAENYRSLGKIVPLSAFYN